MEGLTESVKIGKFAMKIFFSDNVEWSSRKLRKMSVDVRANVTKGLVGVMLNEVLGSCEKCLLM